MQVCPSQPRAARAISRGTRVCTSEVMTNGPSASSIIPFVPVHVPAEISGGGFVDGRRNCRQVGGDVMLEALLADVVQQGLHLWNLDHARATESVQRIVRKPSLAHVAAHLTRGV